jgi:hypothetical protein
MAAGTGSQPFWDASWLEGQRELAPPAAVSCEAIVLDPCRRRCRRSGAQVPRSDQRIQRLESQKSERTRRSRALSSGGEWYGSDAELEGEAEAGATKPLITHQIMLFFWSSS